jgi:hypothetical protein
MQCWKCGAEILWSQKGAQNRKLSPVRQRSPFLQELPALRSAVPQRVPGNPGRMGDRQRKSKLLRLLHAQPAFRKGRSSQVFHRPGKICVRQAVQGLVSSFVEEPALPNSSVQPRKDADEHKGLGILMNRQSAARPGPSFDSSSLTVAPQIGSKRHL